MCMNKNIGIFILRNKISTYTHADRHILTHAYMNIYIIYVIGEKANAIFLIKSRDLGII